MLRKRPTWCSCRGAGTVGASNGDPYVCPKGLTTSADIFAKPFEQEMKAGRLTRTASAKVRGHALVDLMPGLQLRAKAGIAREQLLQDARSYVPLILGKQI